MWYVQLANQTVLALYFCYLVIESLLFINILYSHCQKYMLLSLYMRMHLVFVWKQKVTASTHVGANEHDAVQCIFLTAELMPFLYSSGLVLCLWICCTLNILMYDIYLWPWFEGGVRTEKMLNSFSTGNFCKKENKNSHFWALPGVVWSPFPIFIVKSSKESLIPAWIMLGDSPFDTKSGWSNRALKLPFTGHHCNQTLSAKMCKLQ